MKFSVLAVALMASMSACKHGSKQPDPIGTAWYNVYGQHCDNGAPRPGCNFYADGVKVADFEDPAFATAYNLQYNNWMYTDSYGYSSVYTGFAWLSTTGILYDEYGFALNETNGQGGRDVLADVAEQEEAMIATAGKALAAGHPALSEEKGIEIARALNDWATLGKKGGRTEKDYAAFSERLFGVTADQAKSAIEAASNGDASAIEAMNQNVAAHWSTDAETSKEILKSWYANQIGDLAN